MRMADAPVSQLEQLVRTQFGGVNLLGNVQHMQWGLCRWAETQGMSVGIWNGHQRVDSFHGLVWGVVLIGSQRELKEGAVETGAVTTG